MHDMHGLKRFVLGHRRYLEVVTKKKNKRIKEVYKQLLCCFQTSLPLCHFHGDICTTAWTLLAAQWWPSSKQGLANRSVTLPLCSQRQIAYGWLPIYLGSDSAQRWAIAATPLNVIYETANSVCRAKRQVTG